MADAFDDETEQTITIDEYIKDVEAQELEADLVLGGDDGKECTYPKGHMKRQAIFSCLTCTPNGNAGVCTGCSLSCHDGHEIVELWTKRKFRCDCGNSKFGEFFCKLFADKEAENSENSYNQNFKGFYCTCGHPYPDPDAEEQVEMIQCCICEDWFHENHLGLDPSEELPRDEEGEPLYEDFICQGCAFICSFLTLYPSSVLAPARQSDTPPIDNKENIVLETASSACASAEQLQNGIYSSKNPKIVCATTYVDSETRLNEKDPSLGESSDRNFGSKDDNSCSNNTVITPICALGVDLRVAPLDLEKKKPFFLSKNWRDLLCRCSTCGEFYSQKGIDYLIDKEDTIEEYEKMGKQRREEKLEQLEGAESSFLNNLGHIQKIEILSGIADMKNELKSFLESFDASKPVTSADVQQVFENLAKKKRQRQL